MAFFLQSTCLPVHRSTHRLLYSSSSANNCILPSSSHGIARNLQFVSASADVTTAAFPMGIISIASSLSRAISAKKRICPIISGVERRSFIAFFTRLGSAFCLVLYDFSNFMEPAHVSFSSIIFAVESGKEGAVCCPAGCCSAVVSVERRSSSPRIICFPIANSNRNKAAIPDSHMIVFRLFRAFSCA